MGNEEFEKLMYKYGSKTEYVNSPFYGAMLFADEYERDKFYIAYYSEYTN